MDEFMPSLVVLLDPFRSCFRKEVFVTFRLMLGAWIVCLGRHTISRVWESTGQARQRHHASAFRLFSSAVWDWNEVCCVLCALILVYNHSVPGWSSLYGVLPIKPTNAHLSIIVLPTPPFPVLSVYPSP